MRLDKYLKVSRLIKRRTVAKEASDSEKVIVNGRVAKPSTELKIGDIVEINYFKKTVIVKVVNLFASRKKDDAQEMYEVINVIENN